jgi:hypothetical protein
VYHRDSRVERQRFGEQELEQRILQNWKPLRIVADLSVETHALKHSCRHHTIINVDDWPHEVEFHPLVCE